ncbi:hypothetical protein CY35_05G090200, partial [Sphagnum magellanicum]
KEFTTHGPSISMRHCSIRLLPIVKNSPLLPLIGVWANSSFCSSTYAVLTTVSNCCPPPKGRFLHITHQSATENTT